MFLAKLISCFTTGSVELSLSPRWMRASTTLINMQFLYVLRVHLLGKEDQYISWLNMLYAWIKALYLVNILLMTMFLSKSSCVFILLLNAVFDLCEVHFISFSYCITYLY